MPVKRKAVLVLEDGTVVRGYGFGAATKVSGEVVFNTGMVGYTEAITDPSYKGQILMQTYPLIGNYGVCPDQFESNGPKISGYVIRELCDAPSHWTSTMTLDEWLRNNNVPGISEVDTRMLTKKIREKGTMLGILQVYEEGEEPNIGSLLEEVKHVVDPNTTDLVATVATKKVIEHKANGGEACTVALIDCGVKKSIIESLVKRGVNVWQVPPWMGVDEILGFDPDGVVISNGPGDPKMVPYVIDKVPELVEIGMPMLGICLGNQVIALGLGGDTYKLKFGHRGQNHPCIDLSTDRCYITSQNHGYAVKAESLKGTGVEVTHLNANDKTVEGIAHERKSIFAVQFHPEASPGPKDTGYIFDRFVKMVREKKCHA